MAQGVARKRARWREIAVWVALSVVVVGVALYLKGDPIVGTWAFSSREGGDMVWVFERNGTGSNDAIEAERRRRARTGEPSIPAEFQRGLAELSKSTAFKWKRKGSGYRLSGQWLEYAEPGRVVRATLTGNQLKVTSPAGKTVPASDMQFTRIEPSREASEPPPR